jgi:hypothetical protein
MRAVAAVSRFCGTHRRRVVPDVAGSMIGWWRGPAICRTWWRQLLLAVTVARGGGEVGRFCGSGFADTSRVAEGSPEVWHDIVRTNRVAVADELRAYTRQTDRLIACLMMVI